MTAGQRRLRTRRAWATAIGVSLGLAAHLFAPATVRGQPGALAPRPALRLDAIADAAGTALELGVGLDVVVGTYLRVAATGAGGRFLGDDGGGSARGEMTARFLFDPFRQRRWGLYALGGVGARWTEERRWRGVLVIGLGAELPGRPRPLVPAVELGAGGGGRAGVVVRGGRRGRR